MASPAAYFAERLRKRRVQVEPSKGCLSGEVIAPRPERECAASNQKLFEIHDQRSTNAVTPMRLVNDDRVQLPHEAIVFPNRADPAEDRAVAIDRDTADAIGGDRVQHFPPRFCNLRPNPKWCEGSVQE